MVIAIGYVVVIIYHLLLAPNDLNLANTFMQLMKAGNMDVTRTHTIPWNKLWMRAADKKWNWC